MLISSIPDSLFGVDQFTVIGGIVGAAIHPLRSLVTNSYVSRGGMVIDAFNGAAAVPFLYLMLAVFSPAMLDDLLHTAKASLGLAGLVGLIFVVTEILVPGHSRPKIRLGP